MPATPQAQRKNCQYLQQLNPITVATDMPANQPYDKTPCRSAYGTDRPIGKLYVQPLSPPNARTVLLPESNNCCTDTPAIPIIVVLISLRPIKEELPEDRQDSVLIRLRNRPCASTVLPHTIDKLIAPLCLLLRYRSRRYACDLPTE